MSKQQQSELDAMLRQAPLDDSADVPTLRAGFEEVMRRTPVAGDVRKTPTTVGGMEALEVTIDGADCANVILYLQALDRASDFLKTQFAVRSVPLASTG